MASKVVIQSLLFCGGLWAVSGHGQSYPTKPIRIIVGLAPGGAADVTARLVGQKLSERLGQSVIVENRLGAGGSIATERVAASPPDGYTLMMMTSSGPVLQAMNPNVGYDLRRDLTAVSLAASGPWLIVAHPSVPATNAKELVALARAQPGKLTFASSGLGGSSHLAGELFSQMGNVKLLHIPYKGGSEGAIAAARGEVDLSFSTIPSVLPLLDARKLIPLAVTTTQRASMMPSVPTLGESGVKGYDYSIWVGVLAPAGVPKDIIASLNTSIGQVVNTPEMKVSLNKQGLDPRTNSSEQFAAQIQSEIEQNRKLIRLAGVKPD
jgi:tripartite-type tricarboxylate transporter receptor subunit TctC